jgi:hypothetical protein
MVHSTCSLERWMPPFDAKHVKDAIGRVPGQSNQQIETVLAQARTKSIASLSDVCEQELRLRGSLKLNAEDAARAAAISLTVQDKTPAEIIELAFAQVPPDDKERRLLVWLAGHPGATYQEAAKAYGKGDLSLVIGNLMFKRFGYFKLLIAGATQSDVLIQRDKSGTSVRYTLVPEFAAALQALGIA